MADTSLNKALNIESKVNIPVKVSLVLFVSTHICGYTVFTINQSFKITVYTESIILNSQ